MLPCLCKPVVLNRCAAPKYCAAKMSYICNYAGKNNENSTLFHYICVECDVTPQHLYMFLPWSIAFICLECVIQVSIEYHISVTELDFN